MGWWSSFHSRRSKLIWKQVTSHQSSNSSATPSDTLLRLHLLETNTPTGVAEGSVGNIVTRATSTTHVLRHTGLTRFGMHVTLMVSVTRAKSVPVLTFTWPNVTLILSTYSLDFHVLHDSTSWATQRQDRTSTCIQGVFRRILLFRILAAMLSCWCLVCRWNIWTCPYQVGCHLWHECHEQRYYLDFADSRGRIESVASKQCLYQLYIRDELS